MKARLEAAASLVAKHNAKKKEQNEVTSADFLARLQECRAKADGVEQALADALEDGEVVDGGEAEQGAGVEASVGMEEAEVDANAGELSVDANAGELSASTSKKATSKHAKVAALELKRDEVLAALEALEVS